MTRQEWRAVAAAIEKSVQSIAKEHGLKIRGAGFRFDDNTCKFKLDALTVSQNGKAFDPLAEEFKKFASLFGLNPKDLGKTIDLRGKKLKIVGLNMRKRSYPVIASSDGKRYKLPAADVRLALGRVA